MSERYSPEIKDRVVELYKGGMKGESIAAEVGMPRPTVYLILEQRGIRPSRQKVMQSRQLTVEQALEMVGEHDRRIGHLEAEIERLQGQIDYLTSRNGGL